MVTIEIGGKKRPFKFGFNAIDIFCKEKNIGINEFGERFTAIGSGKTTIGDLRDIVYAGLAGGALTAGQPLDFTTYQVGDWMDELPKGELSKVMDAVTLAINVPAKKKEKVIGKKP